MKIILLGSKGQLGKELDRNLPQVGKTISFFRNTLDITDFNAVKKEIQLIKPDIIVNAAAYTNVDKAEIDSSNALAVNLYAVENISRIAKKIDAFLIHFSTDYVFNGEKKTPYKESDTTNPINMYGFSKLEGEKAIIKSKCKYFIFRTTWVIGKDGNNFAKKILNLAKREKVLKVVNDQIGVPTSVTLISRIVIEAIKSIKNKSSWPNGVYHLTPSGVSNWHEVARTLISLSERYNMPLKITSKDIEGINSNMFKTAAKRPKNSVLENTKLNDRLEFDLPNWEEDFIQIATKIIKENLL